jgi:UDP-2-acetamido-2,6-beta-L-arabino-hexul-4-ose reductase
VKILVTGAQGFVGRNLTAELCNRGYTELYLYDIDTDPALLDAYTKDCDFVFHLAGVNRPQDESEFDSGNRGFTQELLSRLERHNNACPVVVASSAQAVRDNAYGRSKKAAEDVAFAYAQRTGARVMVYRLPNLFGKWCRPNYNSVVATFCHNIARGLDIQLNPDNPELTLCYIDDLLAEFIAALEGREHQADDGFCYVPETYRVRLFELAELLQSFKKSRVNLEIPDMADAFTRKLYSTYLSYLPTDSFSYPLKMNVDQRGSFTEFIRTPERGQVSVNISRPGITKGNHWHHSKNEKFLVVSGTGVIRLRRVGSDEVVEYHVSGDKLQVVDIPPGYTHNIENLGDTDMVTIMWANEPFDPDKPDTYFLEV